MDSSAIQLLQDTAIAAAKANVLPTHTPTVLVGSKIISLEEFAGSRFRFRGTLTTPSIDDFADYVRSHSDSTATGFVDVDSMRAKVFFNLGDVDEPGHGDWTATLVPKPTAAFSALSQIDGKKLSQKTLAEWLEDWNESLAAEYVGGDGTLARAITGVRKLTIKSHSESVHQQDNLRAARSALEEVEAKSGNDLPDGFSFVCEPYVGLASRRFRLALSVITTDDKPSIVLRWQQREATIESIAREFKDVLATKIDGKAALTIGQFSI